MRALCWFGLHSYVTSLVFRDETQEICIPVCKRCGREEGW